jgi:hypothetical protein
LGETEGASAGEPEPGSTITPLSLHAVRESYDAIEAAKVTTA